jgi:hypothetical protein
MTFIDTEVIEPEIVSDEDIPKFKNTHNNDDCFSIKQDIYDEAPEWVKNYFNEVPDKIITNEKTGAQHVQVRLYRDGSIRTADGQVIKGSGYHPKRTPKSESIRRLLRKRYGEKFENLFNKIARIADYEWDPQVDKIKKYDTKTVFEAQKLLLQYAYGRPKEKIEKEINVNVEHKIANVAKLIQQNKEKFKLISNSKENDGVITD